MSTVVLDRPGVSQTRHPDVTAFFDRRTCSVQYIVADPETRCCALIDPVLDFDEKSGSTATTSADALLSFVGDRDLKIQWILDTHPHADHFSAAGYLKEKTGAPTAIGEHVTDVQRLWADIYNLPASFRTDGSQWERLFADGDAFRIGNLEAQVFFSPGHTLASVSYLIGDAAFIHDTLFMPDFGTARCDFPGGDARALWHTIQRILSLPDETRLFCGHDYMPGGRAPAWESTVAMQKAENVHLTKVGSEEEFIALRQARDAKLPMPKLILHALQVNMAGGRLPGPEANGIRYLKVPINALPTAVWD
jgi:glyoxylase-like metal-dependent hydrolase (beta-lactamase superfamily II)